MLSDNAIIEREKLPWQELDGKVVILSPGTTMSHELNETASWVWKNIENKISFKDLLTKMLEVFDVPEEELKIDLDDILDKFKEKSLVDIYE